VRCVAVTASDLGKRLSIEIVSVSSLLSRPIIVS
jgi:hypothetical protein